MVQIPAPDDLSHLLAALYGGLLEDQPWDGFLNALSGYLGASYATLILTAPGQSTPDMMRTPGADPKANEDYLAEFFATDPFQGLPEGEVVSFREFVTGSTDPALAAYQDFLANIGGIRSWVWIYASHPALRRAAVSRGINPWLISARRTVPAFK